MIFLSSFFFLVACEGPHANVPRELRSKIAEQSFRIEMMRWIDSLSNEHIDRMITLIAPDSPLEGAEITSPLPRAPYDEALDMCEKMIYAGRINWRLPTVAEVLELRRREMNKLFGAKRFDVWMTGDEGQTKPRAYVCIRTMA